jgi:c-di-GMP-binding flagellar brake protein YcgR
MRRAQRKKVRVSVFIKKRLKGADFNLIELKTVDVSEAGLFLHSDDLSLFAVNEKLALAAQWKGRRLELGAARVARKQEAHRAEGKPSAAGFGLEFTATTAEQKRHIKQLLK